MKTEEKFQLFQAALKKYKDITPCTGKTWDECYIEYDGVLHLYFNTTLPGKTEKTTTVISSTNLR
jgi:hypothetical protein